MGRKLKEKTLTKDNSVEFSKIKMGLGDLFWMCKPNQHLSGNLFVLEKSVRVSINLV